MSYIYHVTQNMFVPVGPQMGPSKGDLNRSRVVLPYRGNWVTQTKKNRPVTLRLVAAWVSFLSTVRIVPPETPPLVTALPVESQPPHVQVSAPAIVSFSKVSVDLPWPPLKWTCRANDPCKSDFMYCKLICLRIHVVWRSTRWVAQVTVEKQKCSTVGPIPKTK